MNPKKKMLGATSAVLSKAKIMLLYIILPTVKPSPNSSTSDNRD